ncbi:MAG: DUF4854 domain-containing protein [Lachnospiraceae bacterium]|nr:DUF4854 domain-containing protein [Lachnospiraceae bacterium]
MKRKTVKLLFCAALMALTLSVTACGGSGDGTKETDVAAEEETSTEEETPVEEETSAEEETPVEEETSAEEEAAVEEESSDLKTLEEYLKEDSAAMKDLEDQAAAQSNDQMDMAIEITGNDVICIATFKDTVELPDDVADTLNEGMDQMETAFSAIAGVLDTAIGAEKGTVSYGIRYCDADGNVLAEASFRATE